MTLSSTHVRLSPDVSVFALEMSGVAGIADAPRLKKTLTGALKQGCRTLIVNFSRVTDIDRRCWDQLVSAARRLMRLGGRVVLLHCPDAQFELLHRWKWDGCFSLPGRSHKDEEALPWEVRQWIEETSCSTEPNLTPSTSGEDSRTLSIPADDAPVRQAFLRHIGRRFGKPARLVLQEFFANAAEHCRNHCVEVVLGGGRIVVYDHGGGLVSERSSKQAGEGGLGLTLIRAFGGRIAVWREGLRMEYPLRASRHSADASEADREGSR